MANSQKRNGPKSKSKKDDPFKEAIVLIPLTYNDGSKVPRGTIEGIIDEIFAAFDGWTIEGTVKGAYRMKSGQKHVEDLSKVSIILRESQIPLLERMVADWCSQLGQEAMLLKVADATAKFVLPTSAEEKS